MSDAMPVLASIAEAAERGARSALCVVVARIGSAPQVPGAMMSVEETGGIVGTVGGGSVEAAVQRRAGELLAGGSSGVFSFDLDDAVGLDDAPICGGRMDVAITVLSEPDSVAPIREALGELRAGRGAALPIRVASAEGPVEFRINLEPVPKLIIAGGGHVGLALARVAVPLGFHISVIDDRPEYANAERFPPPVVPIQGDIAETLQSWPIDASTYIAIMTRGHRHDEQALLAVLDSDAKYIGMIGSRRKVIVVFDKLRRKGAKQERLERVHAPIGLPIQGSTPEEIAVSIAAELIAVRKADYRSPVERVAADEDA